MRRATSSTLLPPKNKTGVGTEVSSPEDKPEISPRLAYYLARLRHEQAKGTIEKDPKVRSHKKHQILAKLRGIQAVSEAA